MRSKRGLSPRTSSACSAPSPRRSAAPGWLPPRRRSWSRSASTSTAKARRAMPFMRRRPLLRAAAIGGGAYAYGKHRANEQTEMQEDAYSQGQQSAMAAAPPQAAPEAGITSADTARLQELGQLHEQGILTDEEFAQQKA